MYLLLRAKRKRDLTRQLKAQTAQLSKAPKHRQPYLRKEWHNRPCLQPFPAQVRHFARLNLQGRLGWETSWRQCVGRQHFAHNSLLNSVCPRMRQNRRPPGLLPSALLLTFPPAARSHLRLALTTRTVLARLAAQRFCGHGRRLSTPCCQKIGLDKYPVAVVARLKALRKEAAQKHPHFVRVQLHLWRSLPTGIARSIRFSISSRTSRQSCQS